MIDQNDMIIARLRGMPALSGTPETDMDVRNPNVIGASPMKDIEQKPKGVPKGAKPVARITVYTVPKKGKDAGKQPGAAPRPTSRKR